MVLVQGVDGWDVDLPTMLEANVVCNTAMKVIWVFFYLGVYGLRPVIIRPKPNSASSPRRSKHNPAIVSHTDGNAADDGVVFGVECEKWHPDVLQHLVT